jgi:DMSO/TMAO reductase YedYZ molybdopterin-dependent catalytic subunit
VNRRQWLRGAAALGLGAMLPLGCARRPPQHAEDTGADALLRFPGKVPLKVLGDSPPNLETPWRYFRDDLTPNEAFFVRWHLLFVPTAVDLRTWRLAVGGHVERPQAFSMDDLRRMPASSIVAVDQCAGNSRGLFEPHIPGTPWGNGAMGNARWTGVPLRELLDRVGVKAGALDVSFDGLDRSGYSTVADFVKALDVERARDPNVLVAYEMNGQPLPLLNGFPARLIVPGWFGTYWVKALSAIEVLTQRFDGYWMSKAYRIPAPGSADVPGRLAEKTVPITVMPVRSFFVTPAPDARVARGQVQLLDGIAFDGGSGIRAVDVSSDGARTWQPAELGGDLGPFSFRRWRLAWRPTQPGHYRLMVRATNRAGDVQPAQAGWNRAGYLRNVIEELAVEVV